MGIVFLYILDILIFCFIFFSEVEIDVSFSMGRIVLVLVLLSVDFIEFLLIVYIRVWCNDVRLLIIRKLEGIIFCNC